METSKDTNISIPILLVLYDFRYLWKDNREISVKKGEKLLLLEKTNKDWWQVVRPTEKKSFFVPAQYVEVIVKEKTDGRHAGASSRDDSDPSVLYENLDSLKQQADLPSLSSVRKSDINAPKLSRDKKDMIVLSQDGVKQKPIPKTRTKVTGKSTDGTTDLTRSNASDPKYSFSQSSESDNHDKSDKSKINNKTSQDFILSIPKESTPSCAFHEDKNYRGKSAPRAVENLVYCNVPLGGNKSCIAKQDVKPSDVQNRLNIEAGKNRMKNSYNLKTKPTKNTELAKQGVSIKNEVKSQQPPSLKKDKLSFNQNFSKSLEKLAEEIQFEPKKVSAGAGVSTDNSNKGKSAKMPKEISEKKSEKKGKTNDASIVLDETKVQPQSRSVFSRFRRSLHHSSSFKSNNIKRMSKSSKKACELSLSWEGGLDKIQEKKENEEKQQVTPLGLQRSRTFMIVERSPLSLRPTNKIFSGKHRLDTAYHSQRKPEEKVTLSTFKPIFNLDMTTHTPIDLVNKTVEKEPISKYPLERKKLQTNLLGQAKDKNSDEITADKKEESELKPVVNAEENKSAKVLPGKRSGYENVSKKYQKVVAPECDLSNQTTGHKNLTLYTEPYSNSESDDNLEEKSLALIANKSLRSQSSVESNTTVSEETEPSESDENNSLEFVVERRGNRSAEQPANKKRTSLVRSSRVESSKVRKVTARPPPTPPPDQKPLKDLGEGWGAYISKGGRSYYYNEKTGEKNWKPPRRKVALQEKGLDGSHESVCSDFNRSDTSSPSNENFQIFNSNGSLHSKSVDNSSFEMSKSSSVSRWKEDSPDDLNRSSYNSSPITGLSQSSTYSLNKSSRDSLNRFSPIENVPSEEEGLELYDHVYQDDISRSKKVEQGKVEEEERRKSKGSESIDTSTFRIKPGWEEFYDENLDQIFYMFKNRKEKHIRRTPEPYDEVVTRTESDSSDDSIYDNVEREIVCEKSKTSERNSVEEAVMSNREKGIEVTKPEGEKSVKKILCSTWPLRKYPRIPDWRSLKDVLEYLLWEDDVKTWFRSKDEKHGIIHFNWSDSKLTMMKRVLNLSDIIYERGLSESERQEGGKPNMFTSMSNLLASYREKHTQECVWTWLNDSGRKERDDLFNDILSNIKNDLIDFEKSMSLIYGEGKSICDSHKAVNSFENFEDIEPTPNYHRNSLPLTLSSFSEFDFNKIFDIELVREKPPVPPPKWKKRKMNGRRHQPLTPGRRLRKSHLAKVKVIPVPTVELRRKNSYLSGANAKETESENVKNHSSPESVSKSVVKSENEVLDLEASKPLPFPVNNSELEYELNELLMMQRVTDSSKERRRISAERKATPISENSYDIQDFVKDIPVAQPSQTVSNDLINDGSTIKKMSNLNKIFCDVPGDGVDVESRNKVKKFLESKFSKVKYDAKPEVPLKLREDVIIDWENDYENLNEPVVLEGKSVAFKRFPSVRLRNIVQLKRVAEDHSEDNDGCETSCAPETSVDDDTSTIVEDSDDFNDRDVVNTSGDEAISQIHDSPLLNQPKIFFELNCAVDSNKLVKSCPRSKVIEIVARYNKILKECDPKSDTETFDKVSMSSISDGFNSYSDFESDINETIAAGEMWCNERSSDENISLTSYDVSEDVLKTAEESFDEDSNEEITDQNLSTTNHHKLMIASEGRLDTIVEDDEKATDKRSSLGLKQNSKIQRKSASESDLFKSRSKGLSLYEDYSKSLDFFRDSETDGRLNQGLTLNKPSSITSDVCEWMAKIRGIAFAEDRLFSDDDEWILSFDPEERAYFFEETSKKSLWALPDYSSEESKAEFNYSIQRSATESAINNESSAKLRLNKDGGKGGRTSASTRSSKAQSMLIDPKFDISPKDGNKTYSMPRDLSKIYGEIIRFGVLNKTKISENGKKLRKNWTPAFVVLTESCLFFFKDAKSFQNIKNVISANGNHMCLTLQGAVIEKGDKISSRKNVYKISCPENTDVLIQSDKTAEAEEWFKEISTVIQNLPQESKATGNSPLLDLNSPSKVGRTKSLKVRSKDTGSMEDLSSTPEERQNKIKARLKKFFIRRPTVDSLKKKGIWKDEPVFGCSLEQITKNRNPRVPIFVEKCIEFIESKEENMKTDGLYRASGNLSQVQKIRLEVDQNNLSIMKDEEDVHVLTGSLKLFFRELKEPLIPSKQLEPALLATDKQVRKERIKDFQKIVKSLPTPNYDTLKFLLQHLLRVKEYHKYNRMNINNLAIVFGPTLMWPEQESANMALELMQQNVVIECLLKEFHEIFT